MKFQDNVEFREAAAKDRGARVARARMLDARLSTTTGLLEEARFTGSFRFEDGGLRAQSAEAAYRITSSALDLRGRDNNLPPSVSDESIRIDGDAIDITLAPRRMVAKGNIRSVLQPTKGKAGGAKRPGLLGDADPVNVIAAEMTYDEAARQAVYGGGARMLQADTVIQADSIALDEMKGDLSATGNVLTSLALAPEASATPPARKGPTLLRAGTFRYADATRKAIYDTKAQMNGEQGDLHADHIELSLAADENKLDRLDARGAVQMTAREAQCLGCDAGLPSHGRTLRDHRGAGPLHRRVQRVGRQNFDVLQVVR